MFLLSTIYTNCMPSILPQHNNMHNNIIKHDNMVYSYIHGYSCIPIYDVYIYIYICIHTMYIILL